MRVLTDGDWLLSERERKEKAESECRLGAKFEKSGKIDEAIEAYLRAVAEYPAHKKANYRLAELYEEKGELIKSSHHMDMAMHGGPANIPKYPKKAPVKKAVEPVPDKRKIPTIEPKITYSRKIDPQNEERLNTREDKKVRGLLPLTGDNFFGGFESLKEIQRKAVPLILQGRNVLAISSTASGKTEAVFAPLAERLIQEGWLGLSIIYISPTRALISDIRQRLETVLSPLGIRVAQRDGDIKDFDESNPQEVLVTTPESLDSMICWKKHQLNSVKVVVIDEVHMLDGSYRGDQLQILLRRLRREVGIKFNVCAMSATIGKPERTAARFMPSPNIVESKGGRGIEYHITPTLEDSLIWARQNNCSKILVFCNSPKDAETIASNTLKYYFPADSVRVHHGKLEKEMRKETEAFLREAKTAVCACTSTLEVGVDIGDVDLVILYSIPKSVASLAQRIGRSNRRGSYISVAAVGKGGLADYYRNVLDTILFGKFEPADETFDPSVIIQQILSCLASGSRGFGFFSDIFKDICSTEDLKSIVTHLMDKKYILEENGMLSEGPAAKGLGPKIYSNIAGYEQNLVIEASTGMPIGHVELPVDNIFILSGQAWSVKKKEENKIIVEKVDRRADVAKFSTYEQNGAFHNMLPDQLKSRKLITEVK